MQPGFNERLIDVGKQELIASLEELCNEVGAAESSLLLPRSDSELFFFVSTNPVLMQPSAPLVPSDSMRSL